MLFGPSNSYWFGFRKKFEFFEIKAKNIILVLIKKLIIDLETNSTFRLYIHIDNSKLYHFYVLLNKIKLVSVDK